MFAEGALVNRKYRILAELGQGCLGTTYKALVLGSNSVCVIKVLDPALVPSQIPKDLVEQAVLKSRELRNDSAIPWQSVEANGEIVLVREFADGQSLKSRLQERKPFPLPQAISLVRQMALGLDAAHRQKITHGDLRPENILLGNATDGDRVRLLDFGMARLKDKFAYSLYKLTLKDAGPLMGDPRYLSPEQALGLCGDALDIRSDIYSLGIIFFQLLTGALPFLDGAPIEILTWHTLGDAPDFSHYVTDLKIPEEYGRLIQSMLARRREDRMASLRPLIQQLKTSQASLNTDSTKPIPPPNFTLLSDGTRTMPISKPAEPRAAAKAAEPPAPSLDAQSGVASPAEAEITVKPPARHAAAAVLPISAVEIKPIRAEPPSPTAAPATQRLSGRGWATAASILVLIAGLAAGAYYFKGQIQDQAQAVVNPERLEGWVSTLKSWAQATAHQANGALRSWTHDVEADLAFNRSTPASAAIPATGAAQFSTQPAQPTPSSTTPVAALATRHAGAAGSKAASGGRNNQSMAALDRAPAPASAPVPNPTPDAATVAEANPPAAIAPGRLHPPRPKSTSRQASPQNLEAADTAARISKDLRSGDALFELGQYDQAVSRYRDGLAVDPTNKVLLDRIARAKRAKAAEAEFLNQ
jgi:serine/threonine protein kinase